MAMPVSGKKLLVLVGATAVGKTAVSLDLAHLLNCPIISADSRQCYRELGVATAKPTEEQLKTVRHFFIDTHSIHKPITAAEFERYALKTLEQVHSEHRVCIMTGGSGLYVKAVVEGMDEIPDIPIEKRLDLEQRLKQKGLKPLVEELKKLDPVLLETLDGNNPRRVIRALAVCHETGKPFSTFRTGNKSPRPFEVLMIGLHRERKQLYQRIEQRMDQMIEQGLFEEAAKLFKHQHLTPLQTVGYQEVFGYLEGKYDRDEAIRLLKRNSRRYAKRQLTWFNKNSAIKWFDADNYAEVLTYTKKILV